MIAGHAQADQVVAQLALTEQHAIDHCLSVDHEPHRLPQARVVKRRERRIHRETHRRAARRRALDHDVGIVLLGKRDRRRQLVGEVNLARLQRIDPRIRVADRNSHHTVQRRRFSPPVLVTHELHAVSAVVGRDLERTRAVGQRQVLNALGHYRGVERQRGIEEIGPGPQHRQLEGQVVECGHVRHVHVGPCLREVRAGLPVAEETNRERDISRGQRFAVVERHIRPQFDRPNGCIFVRRHALCDARLDAVGTVQREEVERPRHRVIRQDRVDVARIDRAATAAQRREAQRAAARLGDHRLFLLLLLLLRGSRLLLLLLRSDGLLLFLLLRSHLSLGLLLLLDYLRLFLLRLCLLRRSRRSRLIVVIVAAADQRKRRRAHACGRGRTQKHAP